MQSASRTAASNGTIVIVYSTTDLNFPLSENCREIPANVHQKLSITLEKVAKEMSLCLKNHC